MSEFGSPKQKLQGLGKRCLTISDTCTCSNASRFGGPGSLVKCPTTRAMRASYVTGKKNWWRHGKGRFLHEVGPPDTCRGVPACCNSVYLSIYLSIYLSLSIYIYMMFYSTSTSYLGYTCIFVYIVYSIYLCYVYIYRYYIMSHFYLHLSTLHSWDSLPPRETIQVQLSAGEPWNNWLWPHVVDWFISGFPYCT